MTELPHVRYFLACRKLVTDHTRRDYTLERLVYSINRMPDEPLPCVCAAMTLFAVMTGRGLHTFGFELARFHRGDEFVVRRTTVKQDRQIDLGMDPNAVHGLPIPLTNVIFEEVGQYAFHLLCDSQRIAHLDLEVR